MTAAWSPSSWRSKANQVQIPVYRQADRLATAEAQLKRFPPLVFAGETQRLKSSLATVRDGRAFLFQGGDCAESFAEHDANYILGFLHVFLQIAIVLTVEGGAVLEGGEVAPIVKIGRIAGQFAKPRSSDIERQGDKTLPSYRGDIINGPEFNELARDPDPQRLLQAYGQSAATLNFIRSLIEGHHASLKNARKWVLNFEKGEFLKRYDAMIARLSEAFATLEPFGGIPDATRAIHHTDIYTSHEALLLGYEEALTRQDTLLGSHKWFDTSAHMVWIGDRTRQPDHACIEFCRGIANPIGLKCGPSLKPDELVRLLDILDPQSTVRPDGEGGRMTLICRFGADKVAAHLPPLIRAVQKAGRKVVWSCDPMHGNTITASGGKKTRPFDLVTREIRTFFEVHQAEGSYPGGVHLEMTGDNVTECIGGASGVTERDLTGEGYVTACDPRLNANQSLEAAFIIAELLKAYRRRNPSNQGRNGA